MRATAHYEWLRVIALLCGGVLGSGCDATTTREEPATAESPPGGIGAPETPAQHSSLSQWVTEVQAVAPPPALDGQADRAFQRAPAQKIARVVRGARPGWRDLTATWRALHDAVALYLFVEVVDERVVVDSDATTPWEDDAVEIFLDGNASGGSSYDGIDDVQLVVRPGQPAVQLGVRSAPARAEAIGYRSQRRDHGYAVELSIPWSAVGTSWYRGKTLGLDVHVDDDDGATFRESKLTWWSYDDEAWQLPERFGSVRLVGGPGQPDAAYFVGLGDLPGGPRASYVTDLSVSGAVVVGYSEGASGSEAVRWSREGGLVGLGGAPSRAEAVSPNGELVVGSGTATDPEPDSGVIWRGTQPPASLRVARDGPPGAPPMFFLPEPTVVRDDGVVFGSCIQYGAYGQRLACSLDTAAKVTLLLPMSAIYDVDAAGNRAGTRAPAPRGEPIGRVAMLNERELGYPTRGTCVIPHDCRSEARALSAGAAVVVGTSVVPVPSDEYMPTEGPMFDTAFVYTAAEGLQRLPDLAGGVEGNGAYAVSADGRLIAGFGTDDSNQHAVVWIGRAPRKLSDLVAESGGRVPEGWSLLEVRAMSADGRTFAGNALNAQGEPEGFRVMLPRAP